MLLLQNFQAEVTQEFCYHHKSRYERHSCDDASSKASEELFTEDETLLDICIANKTELGGMCAYEFGKMGEKEVRIAYISALLPLRGLLADLKNYTVMVGSYEMAVYVANEEAC